MAVTWDQETFRRTYGDANCSGLGSTFAGDVQWWRRLYEQRIVPVFGNITGAQRILVTDCGLSLLVSAVQETGFANIWGIDRSPTNRGERDGVLPPSRSRRPCTRPARGSW